ncbi:MAG TPA: ATP-binding protein [Caulobacteraceae bacterium]|nr:ATP-binding protein [Caulobacteraceae bacterium]
MSFLDRFFRRWRRPQGPTAWAAPEAPAPRPAVRLEPEAPRSEPHPVQSGIREPAPAAASFPRFASTATDQFSRSLADRLAAIRMKLREAFTPGQPITERKRFAGRTKLLAAVIRALEDQRLHVIVFGDRGIGKTSLLHVLTQAAKEARYQVVYFSCGAGSTFEEVIRTVAGGIPLLYHADFGPTSAEAESGGTFAKQLPEGESISTRAAGDLLTKVVGTRVLMVLDEFDRSEQLAFRQSIAELIKILSDRKARVQLVIAGVAANVHELVRHIPSIQRNVLALQVPKMTGPEIRHLVRTGEESSGVAFEDDAIREIVRRSIGFPYLASLLSHHASLAAVEAERTTVIQEDVATAVEEATQELRARLSARTQAQVDRCVDEGLLKALGALAGAAQTSAGQFTLEDVTGLFATAEEIASCRDMTERLAREHVLLEARDDDTGRHFRFLDETVPSYLWLLAIHARDAEETEPVADHPTPAPANL